jgi:ribosomal protein S18 acetylase RimI-like enzyme
MTSLRAAGLRDLAGVYRVCHETGDPAADQNPDLLGHVFAGPYLIGQPSLARVVADPLGIAGYLLGCEDTRAFEAWCEAEWWPALREQYPLDEASAVDAEMIGLLHRPPRSPDAVVAEYPAHLHIDFLPRARGAGHGRVLIEWLCAELARRGVPGVHLGVGVDNPNAIAFYGHLGFTTAEVDDGTRWMTRRLAQDGG